MEDDWGNCPKCGWPIHIPSLPSESAELTRWKRRVGGLGVSLDELTNGWYARRILNGHQNPAVDHMLLLIAEVERLRAENAGLREGRIPISTGATLVTSNFAPKSGGRS